MTENATRVRRTPAEIAQDELERATKAVERTRERIARATEELAKAKAELTRVQRYADYAASHPDLPQTDTEHDVPAQIHTSSILRDVPQDVSTPFPGRAVQDSPQA